MGGMDQDEDDGGPMRLARRVRARRTEALDIGIREAAAAARTSLTTWTKVEAGELLSGTRGQRIYARIDRALGWSVGSCRTVLDGGEPALDEKRYPGPPGAKGAKEALNWAESLPAGPTRDGLIAMIRTYVTPDEEPLAPDRRRDVM